jgi:hypothetical protein
MPLTEIPVNAAPAPVGGPVKAAAARSSTVTPVKPATPGSKRWALDSFEVGKPLGRGKVQAQHGVSPRALPSPATHARAPYAFDYPLGLLEIIASHAFYDCDSCCGTQFGNVYMAREKESGAVVALKVIFKKQVDKHGVLEQLREEIEIQTRLRHPGILRMHGFFHDEKRVYLVLEIAPGGELFKRLQAEKTFSEEQAGKWISQLAAALRVVHQHQVMHRDIKPENLLLDQNDNIKIADFGWSTVAKNKRKTFCGTLDYLAPEMGARCPPVRVPLRQPSL